MTLNDIVEECILYMVTLGMTILVLILICAIIYGIKLDKIERAENSEKMRNPSGNIIIIHKTLHDPELVISNMMKHGYVLSGVTSDDGSNVSYYFIKRGYDKGYSFNDLDVNSSRVESG